MDPVTLVFYAAVCAALGWAGPRLGTPPIRLGVGALVGIVASTLLPWIRVTLGL